MSARPSRRSCSNSNQLNRCTIPLWDKKRLVKELQERNLDTTGKQPDLVDRLLAFLDGNLVAAPTPQKKTTVKKVATPKTPKSAKKSPRGRKKLVREVKQEREEEEEEEEEDVVEVEPAEEPETEVVAPEANGAVKIKEEPAEDAEDLPEEPTPPTRRPSRKQNKENATPAQKKREPKKKPVKVEEVEDAPSTSSSFEQAAAPESEGDEKRCRRKSARLLASEQMEVDAPMPEEDAEPMVEQEIVEEVAELQEEASEKADEEGGRKLTRVKTESDSDGSDGKEPQASNSSDPDFDVARHSKRIKEQDSIDLQRHEKAEKVKKPRHSSSSISSAPPPKPKQSDWQLEWAKKMAEHKKAAVQPEKTEKTATEKSLEVKRKESGEKSDAGKKKKTEKGGPLETIDTITALMSSSIVKKEKVEKKVVLEPPPARIGGGSDATSTPDYNHGPYSRPPAPAPPMPMVSPQQKQYPMGMFFNPPTVKLPPMMFPPVRMMPMPPGGIPLLPPPPPPIVPKRRSRFDQPPADFAASFFPKANAPPPTLTTAIKISRKSPIPPPPPPRRKDDIPPPPPKPKPAAQPAAPPVSAATTELQRRVQELFSGEAASPVPVVFAPPTAPIDDSIPPPPPKPKPVETGPTKRPLVKDEVEKEVEGEDDDEEFVIRDTVVETKETSEPAPKMMRMEAREDVASPPAPPINGVKEDEAPKAINKIEEQKKKEAIAEERRRRAMELGDGEYDPMDTTGNDESTLVYEYQPTNAEEVYETTDDEMLEGDDEEDVQDEAAGDEEEEEDGADEEQEEQVDKDDNDPIEITHNAKDLLKLLTTASEEKKNQYMQLANDIPTESLLTRQEDEKPEEVYYHGEPVPEVDENELYEIAAGIKPKKKEKKALVQIPEEERVPVDVETIELDYYNADIHVKSAEKNIWQIEPFCQDGLALMWGGVRSNFGIELPFKKTDKDKAKKLGFQIRVDAYQSIQHLPSEFMSDGGDVRIGFSLGSTPLVLGEYTGSWCISASGKQATNNYFSEFGHSFDIGDVVTCILDLEEESISYLINGKDVGTPYKKISLRAGDIIYPTICTKNANISVNLGQELSDEKWSIDEDRDWMFITEMNRAHLIRSHVAPAAKKDCTVLMTVGLPGVGKTTWVRRYLAEHPHEHWTLISADVVMDAMKVNGVPRIRLPTLKRPDFLRGIIGKSMARLILLAPRRRKNYILDMTNCFADKRKRKLMAFEEFNRKCMIFVPEEHEHMNRLIKQEHEENEKLDTDAMMQHKAAMSLPSIENADPCEEVIFIDPPAPHEHLAFERVSKMNYDCRSWLVVPGRRRGGGGYHGHGGHFGNRGYHNDHHGGGGYQQNQYNRPSTSGTSYTNALNSPRAMNITHTTFPSSSAQPVASSPRVRFEDQQTSSAAASAFSVPPPTQPQTIVLPPVHIKPQISSAQPSPVVQNNFSFPPAVQSKVEVSQPLTLNTSQPPRKSFDMPGPSSAVSSGSRSSFSNSPRFGFSAKEPTTPTLPPTSIPPPQIVNPVIVGQPSPLLMSQPPPSIMMVPRPSIPMFPIDVTVPPPNFSAPPPPLPGVIPPQLIYPHQMNVPPPQTPQQFTYPPPQFAPR